MSSRLLRGRPAAPGLGPRALVLTLTVAGAATALALDPMPALAQSAPATADAARPDPTRTGTPVPALQHRSALQTYRRLTDTPRGDWRAANAEVARIGGWRAYLREAHRPDPATSAPGTPGAPLPTSGGHPGLHGGRR